MANIIEQVQGANSTSGPAQRSGDVALISTTSPIPVKQIEDKINNKTQYDNQMS